MTTERHHRRRALLRYVHALLTRAWQCGNIGLAVWHHDETTAPDPKRIALVAHDDGKGGLLEWAECNRDILADHILYATGTTGRLLGETLDLPVTCFQSGPLGGDQQIGALIASGRLDMLRAFYQWDQSWQRCYS